MEMNEMATCGNIKARASKLMVYTHYFEGEKIFFFPLISSLQVDNLFGDFLP
jgi:hypothetical protein